MTVLPVAELRDALSGSALRARHYFLAYLFNAPIPRDKFEKLLPNKEVDLSVPLEKVLPDYGKDIEFVDILNAQKKCGVWKRDCRTAATAAKALIGVFANSSEPLNQQEETYFLDEMQTALKLEWLKKQYKNTEEKGEQATLGRLAETLGEKEWLRELRGSAQSLDALKAMWHNETMHQVLIGARRKEKAFLEEAKEFEALELALNIASLMILSPEITKYCRQVNKFLPKGDKFGIRHDLKSFSIFLKRGEEEHHALSGSTEARVLAAMGAALSSTSGLPAMLILDDRMWDGKTLSKTMERLESLSSQFQVILMSTFKPRGRARAKWNYVDIESKGYAKADEEVEVETEVETEGSSLEETSE